MYDFVDLSFELAFKYRNPVMILGDGIVGQMMEKVELRPAKPRRTDEEVRALCDSWATLGKPASREGNIVTSLALDAEIMERFNIHLQNKYATIEANEARYETYKTEDAEYLIVAFGCMSRICENVVELAREDGIKLGVLRPITLYPYPEKALDALVPQMKSIMSVELNSGQMVEDVRRIAAGRVPVHFYGRQGGAIPSPEEIYEAFVKKIKK
jgi:2-oxoglutarate ferredoxin oxidoreductase subunit alpha